MVDLPAGAFGTHDAADQRAGLFTAAVRVALAYADAMTVGDVTDDLFERVRSELTDDEIVELTEVVAWENASARFNRALRIGSQHLWHRAAETSTT